MAKKKSQVEKNTTKLQEERPPKQRFNLVLPKPAVEELTRIEQLTGQSTSELMRWALVLLGRYIRAMQQDEEVRIVNPKNPNIQRIVDLPIAINRKLD